MERSLVVVKPDGVVRGLVGDVIKRFEQRGMKIIGLKLMHVGRKFAEKHYTEDISKKHGKKVREGLLRYITEGPVVAFVIEGVSAVDVVRKIAGTTYPDEALIGTIRGDFAHISKKYANSKETAKLTPGLRNVVHTSGSKKEAEIEVKMWFSESELYTYSLVNEKHIL